ncbi:metalloregulator ArsR/SmtB family transcription factor [Streptomyces sp. XM4193]|uniref:metalloregulator ArsR/SmtB family transcription factor n=1 Tax=Streptomyces sp. XM4193 TaxID=2929782 RepID=UPI001FF72594|nr:metalloregulator ArsR/SmtB family transcription factor [Streptomyces sp. XM4193]MCK1798960.1 metalloregulator ArsR/SmtB family transcription factor [Streptomyces sp. XM4193]
MGYAFGVAENMAAAQHGEPIPGDEDRLSPAADAIADPVRREILALLRSGPMTAGTIAARFTISRPAVSRHLRVLRTGGLVDVEEDGRRRRYRLRPDGFVRLADWIGGFGPTAPADSAHTDDTAAVLPGWAARLAALDTEVRRTRRERGSPHGAEEPAHRAVESAAPTATPITTAPTETTGTTAPTETTGTTEEIA